MCRNVATPNPDFPWWMVVVVVVVVVKKVGPNLKICGIRWNKWISDAPDFQRIRYIALPSF